jgi:AcrR family transcriptional regulator
MDAVSKKAAMLAVSQSCCDLFIARGTTAISISDMCDTTGVAPRTFHRWFRAKADVLQPVFEWGTSTFNGVIAAADIPLSPTVLEHAFDAAFEGENSARTRDLFPLVLADPELWAVFLRAVHHGEVTLAQVLASRWSTAPDDIRARMTSAAVAVAFRVAIERSALAGGPPKPVFLDAIRASGVADASHTTTHPTGSSPS